MSHKILEPRPCSVEGCCNLSIHLVKGMCQKHYTRMYRNGSIVTVRSMHGLTDAAEYKVWSSMIQRCTNPRSRFYKDYGGRGIRVCKRWLKFDNFYGDMGRRPHNGTLDRNNNNGDYEPSNCSWITQKEQSNNTRRNRWIEFNGERMTISQWADRLGLKYETLYSRLKTMPPEKALSGELYG